MSTQHTPGPWSITERAVVANASTPVAHRVKWWSAGLLEIEERANASLISAAPELLAALEELTEIVQGAIEQRSAKDLDSFTLQPAIAAIAKAKGRA